MTLVFITVNKPFSNSRRVASHRPVPCYRTGCRCQNRQTVNK